jgi:hypothetical protein
VDDDPVGVTLEIFERGEFQRRLRREFEAAGAELRPHGRLDGVAAVEPTPLLRALERRAQPFELDFPRALVAGGRRAQIVAAEPRRRQCNALDESVKVDVDRLIEKPGVIVGVAIVVRVHG